MTDLPPGWAQAEARRLESDDEPEICRLCDNADDCACDPCDCMSDAAADDAERRFESERDARD